MDDLRLDAENLALPINHAPHLQERYQLLIESVSDRNPGAIFDHSKALLETICRTIITDRNGHISETPDSRASFIELYRQTCACLMAHDSDTLFMPIIKKSLQVIADMRDNYGVSSHGRDGYSHQTGQVEESLFVARVSLAMAGYLYARHVNTSTDHQNERLHYEDNPEFNEYLDQDGDIEIAGIIVASPSRVLFDNDLIAYREKLIEFVDADYADEMDAAADAWAEMQSDIERGH